MPIVKEYRKVSLPVAVKKVCNCCKKEIDVAEDVLDAQEWLVYEWITGYSSIFGDEQKLSLVLCQECTKRLLGHYVTNEEGKYVL